MKTSFETDPTYTAFSQNQNIASGDLATLLLKVKTQLDENKNLQVLIFEDSTGRQVDFDFRGSAGEVITRAIPVKAQPGPGRPKLGVICREVSLLPRHWDWLEAQPQGISAALRRLIDEAKNREPDSGRVRRARDATAKFMWAMTGGLPHFEEATRALFAGDDLKFAELIAEWPRDVRDHIERMLLRCKSEST